jgi:hypothetical protein
VAGCGKFGDEPSGSSATGVVIYIYGLGNHPLKSAYSYINVSILLVTLYCFFTILAFIVVLMLRIQQI